MTAARRQHSRFTSLCDTQGTGAGRAPVFLRFLSFTQEDPERLNALYFLVFCEKKGSHYTTKEV